MMDGETFPNGPSEPDPNDAIVAEVTRILSEGGYSGMGGPPFTGLLCKAVGGGFWMGGVFDPIPGDVDSFHTHMAVPPRDPIDAAHWMVAKKREKMRGLGMLADLTTEATLETPVVNEGEESVSRETEAEQPLQSAPVDEASTAIDAPSMLEGEFADFGEPEELGAELLETDFCLDPLLLGDEAEPSEAPATDEPTRSADYTGPTFIGLDDLDRLRAVACHRVRMYAKTLKPFWTTNEQTALTELRNYVLGVQVNDWPDDPARRAELDALEAVAARLNQIEAARDAKVEFLESASRGEIEAFDYADGWP